MLQRGPGGVTIQLRFEPLTDGRLDEAIAFLRRANPFAQHTWGWDTGRLIDWRWGSNVLRARAEPGFFARHGSLVLDDGEPAALVLSEVGADDHCILTASPDRARLEAILADVIERRGDAPLTLFPSDRAAWILETLDGLGFERGPVAGVEWGYDLGTSSELLPPPGFTVDSLSMDREADYAGIAACLERAFGGVRDRVAVLRSLETNPMFIAALSIVARTIDGRIVAYCRGTVDSDSGVGGIDPVATDPEFQGRGLGKAIVRACFAAQARRGGTTTYIGSAPEPSPGSRLYRSLGPSSLTGYSEWKLPLSGTP